MRTEFLSGYVKLVEGEKDPRNLMTAFAVARVILIEFDITDHVEVRFMFLDGVVLTWLFAQALFNITFCYFPISFRPPADDPYGISPDDLKMALRWVILSSTVINSCNSSTRSCLCATPLFGPLAIPVYLEKLIAGSPISKVANIHLGWLKNNYDSVPYRETLYKVCQCHFQCTVLHLFASQPVGSGVH